MNKNTLKIEYVRTEILKEYENNAKLHPQEQIDQIKKSITEFGMNDPIAIWKDNIIIEGHGRLIACKQLNIEIVPIIRLDNLTDDQRKAYTLIHNQTTMNTGFDLDLLSKELENIDFNMTDFGFENITEEDIEIQEDNFEIDEEELKPAPSSKYGEIYKLGNHILMCGDSTNSDDVEKLMNGNIADLVVTDPPYNVAIQNSQGMTIENDDMDSDLFKEFIHKAVENMSNNLKPGGAYYMWYGDIEDIAFRSACIENKLLLKQCLIWVKNQFTLGRQDYQWRHEPCLYGWKQGEGHYFIYDRTQSTVIEQEPIDFDNLSKQEAIKLLKNIYKNEIPSTIIKEDKPKHNDLHPTMKPISLIARLINNSSEENNIVLDLFGGSGTTLIACEQINRICYMMEYDPKYVDVIIKRWEDFTGNKAVKYER